MITITKEFTKEQLVEHLRTRIEHRNRLIASMHIDRGYRDYLKLELLSSEIALASLEAEAVAYVDPFAFNNFSVYRAGDTDNKRMGREWMWANPDVGLIPVYTAPPAPVSVPDFSALDRLAGEMLTHAMNCERRVSVAYTHCAHRLAEEVRDLRAAMLQGAENDESPTTMHTAPALDSSPKIAESTSGNSPVIPDGSASMLQRWLAFGRGMQNAGSQLPHNLIAETEEMLAAAPQPVPVITDNAEMITDSRGLITDN